MLGTTKIIGIFVHCLYLCNACFCLPDDTIERKECPLWHVLGRNGECECGASFNGLITCDETYVYVSHGHCLTWSNDSEQIELHTCLFTRYWNLNDTSFRCNLPGKYRIPIGISSQELNHEICDGYNRQGPRCKQCRHGYGPAVFSYGNNCVDCSSHRHLWIVHLFLQLLMITIMYLMFIALQISVISSPFNILITYIQVISNGFKLTTLIWITVVCYLGQTLTDIIFTVTVFFNLDFFYVTFPKSCVSSSIREIDVLLFEYIVAFYPTLLTIVFYTCIELYDRNNRLLVTLGSPMIKCCRIINKSWSPKTTILKTFTSFFLFSYSKLFFISINLLLADYAYNNKGERISNSAFLLYDPNIKLFHSEHVPYVILAFSILLFFIIFPIFLLLIYPTNLFRKTLLFLGVQRLDIIHHLMDIFQGEYKDGTDGTRDYRFLSVLCLLVRIGLGCEFVALSVVEYNGKIRSWQWLTPGIFHVLVGTLFFILKPYKRVWMSHIDGLIFTSVGIAFIMVVYGKISVCMSGIGLGLTVIMMTGFYTCAAYKCIKGCIKTHNSIQ